MSAGFLCSKPRAPGRPALRYLFVMPIDDLQQAAQKIAGFLNNLNKLGGLRLKYRIALPMVRVKEMTLRRGKSRLNWPGPMYHW